MRTSHGFLTALAGIGTVIAVAAPVAAGSRHGKPPVQEFAVASIIVEQNATDGDTEVVITATGGDEGLRQFEVHSPDQRRVLAVNSNDPTVMGLREYKFESPEPEGEAILAAYPEGTYRFKGRSLSGERFVGEAELSHDLPLPTAIIFPIGDSAVGVDSLTIQWTEVPGVAMYLLELENESADPEQSLTLNLPPGTTSLDVPASWLAADAEYQVGVATVAPNGNTVLRRIDVHDGMTVSRRVRRHGPSN